MAAMTEPNCHVLQVPTRIFITEALPKGPTGKVQRRFMVDAFINKKKQGEGDNKGGVQKNATAGGGAAAASPSSQGEPPLPRPPRSRL